MADILFNYSRARRDFGRPPDHFADYPPTALHYDLWPDYQARKLWTKVNPQEREADNVPCVADASTNTDRTHVTTKGMVHYEGGWPQGVEATENTSRWKYIKKLERNEHYAHQVSGLVETTNACLRQNNALDMYERYFEEDSLPDPMADPSVLYVTEVLRCPNSFPGSIVRLSWSPSGGRLAAAHADPQRRLPATAPRSWLPSMLWDVTRPDTPDACLALRGSELHCVQYAPKDPHLIAGGCSQGRMHWWDVRAGPRPVSSSEPLQSHTDAVTDLRWLTAKTCEAVSVSRDGRALWWDLRQVKRLADGPLPLKDPAAADGPILGGVCLYHDPLAGGPARLLIGCDGGTVISCTRKGQGDERIECARAVHHGPVYSVAYSPGLGQLGGAQWPQHTKGYFLTASDWTVRVWADQPAECGIVPIWQTPYRSSQVMGACWVGESCPGAFICARLDGRLEVWDLIDRQCEPVCMAHVSSSAVTCLDMQQLPHGNAPAGLLAAGDADGNLRLCRLSGSVTTASTQRRREWIEVLQREESAGRHLNPTWWPCRERALRDAKHGAKHALSKEKTMRIRRAKTFRGKRPGQGSSSFFETPLVQATPPSGAYQSTSGTSPMSPALPRSCSPTSPALSSSVNYAQRMLSFQVRDPDAERANSPRSAWSKEQLAAELAEVREQYNEGRRKEKARLEQGDPALPPEPDWSLLPLMQPPPSPLSSAMLRTPQVDAWDSSSSDGDENPRAYHQASQLGLSCPRMYSEDVSTPLSTTGTASRQLSGQDAAKGGLGLSATLSAVQTSPPPAAKKTTSQHLTVAGMPGSGLLPPQPSR
eukprot:TRINITY_DN4245_c0_g1_i1.p1 TRINITY_DN4245_c0_g1~~TRINITY_DN4245_c0_g1_i1.p1  ORF type:complete len:820 (+),score=102.58 TRINITY_DN4245_c0_g1_i1:89-2548(+)